MWRALAFGVALVLLGCGSSEDPGEDSGAGGSGGGGGESGFTPLEPATFEYEEIEGASCGNGTPFGVGISEGSDETELVLFLNGGGACWDSLTCFGLKSASNIEATYDARLLETELAPLYESGLVDRGLEANPFAQASLVFVPYCTGDLFAGEVVRDYQVGLFGEEVRQVHHVGRANVRAVLDVLARRFPKLEQIYLMGASAGGYGAAFNYQLIAAAFPKARVDLLIDGAPFVEPKGGLYSTWRTQWQVEGPDCENCESELGAIVEDLHASYPDRRFALLTSQNDEVIRLFFGYGLEDMSAQVNQLVTRSYESDHAKAFVVSGTAHVLLGGYKTGLSSGGVRLSDFVNAWATGSAAFETTRP